MPVKLSLVFIILIAFALRVYALNDIPNGVFTDEAARGYDAFSIAHTGRDMHGAFLPLFARGFDDYTPTLYTYLTVPFVSMLNLSPFSTRLAAVWIGIITMLAAYQVIRYTMNRPAALITIGLLALSPWHILLNRIGTEWSLLALGPTLTVALAYRGLRNHPRWLVAAGVAAGLSLYGYAPIKAFLPLLGLVFVAFYASELRQYPRAVTAGFIGGLLLAIPVYVFSFTPEGMARFDRISYLGDVPTPAMVHHATTQYLAYFQPHFLLYTDPTQPDLFYIQRLRFVGLLYWVELPLIIWGVIQAIRTQRRDHYFLLVWLLLAPIGINLHEKTKPALFLTATPILHALAGFGAAHLWQVYHHTTARLRLAVAATGLILMLGLGLNASVMAYDLFTQFPVYAPHTRDWGYGLDAGIDDLLRQQPHYDQASIYTFNIVTGLYVAYHTRYPPAQRHQELQPADTWTQLGTLTIAPPETVIHQPGCHVMLSRESGFHALVAPWTHLQSYPLPDGQSSGLMLAAVSSNHTLAQPVKAVFANQILLDSFGIANHTPPHPGQTLCVVLNWQSTGNLTDNLTVFLHLTDGTTLITQHDGLPADGRHPTYTWQPGQVIADMHLLSLPPTLAPGTYELRAGLYHANTGVRLPTATQDYVVLDQLVIAP